VQARKAARGDTVGETTGETAGERAGEAEARAAGRSGAPASGAVPDGAGRAQRLAAAALISAGVAILVWRCAASPGVTWIWQHGDAAWITDPRPVDATIQGYGGAPPPVVTFSTRFRLPVAPDHAELRLRAARAYRVLVDGQLAWSSPDPDPAWRSDRTRDVAPLLHVGDNELAVEVWNPRGPPLLRARLSLPDRAIATSTRWRVARTGEPDVDAVLPDDTRPHPSAAAGPRPARALATRGPALAALFALACLGWTLLGPRLARRQERLPGLALLVVHVVWGVLFVRSFLDVPLAGGFDARHHLHYVELLRERGSVPLPSAGWSTFHPPLYYVLVALLQAAAGGSPTATLVATKSVSFAAGLGQAWIAWGLARTLVPGRPVWTAAAVLAAGCLPLDLYMAAYVSNEPLHGFLFGLSTLLCVVALARCRVRLRDALALGAALGAALATKVTALVVAGVAGAALLGRAAAVERARPRRLVVLAAGVAAPALALAGWWYLRNWRLYGSPVVGNWDLPGLRWWSQPGFHTWRYYLGFGTALDLPVFSGFRSFADAVYSSFWGDGWVAGRATAAILPGWWNWGWAALGYWLAVPATGAMAVGIVRSVGRALHGPRRAAWSFVLALEGALVLAFVLLTLELPYFGQAKAPYLLGLAAPLSVQLVLGADACDTWLGRSVGPAAATAWRALLTTTAVVFVLAAAGP
jgi:hypothetical protein